MICGLRVPWLGKFSVRPWLHSPLSSTSPPPPPLLPLLTRHHSLREFVTRQYSVFLLISVVFQSIAQLVGPPIAGALFGAGTREEQLHNFPRLIILGSMMLTVATGVTIVARFKLEKRIWAVI